MGEGGLLSSVFLSSAFDLHCLSAFLFLSPEYYGAKRREYFSSLFMVSS